MQYSTSVQVLYGGSVNANNVADIAAIEFVDGVIVGGASICKTSMLRLCDKAELGISSKGVLQVC